MGNLASRNLKIGLVLIGLLSVIACASVRCGADSPPVWRGTPGTTYEDWNFTTSASPTAPETFTNAFGTPSATIDYNPPYGTGWTDVFPIIYGTAQGWWDIAKGSIALGIVNHPAISATGFKDFQVQVAYWKDISQAPTVVISPTATFVNKTTTQTQKGPIMGAWYLDIWTFHIDSNGNSETITLVGDQTNGSMVDRVTVDTRYVATPGSAAQARSLPNDTLCSLVGPVVTRSFDTYFYIEDLTRAAGIRVNCASGQAPAAEGTIPQISGVIRTVNGERAIDQATLTPGGSGSVRPLAIGGRAVSQTPTIQALLVRLYGKASVTAPGATSFTVDDGGGTPVRVELHGTPAPADGSHVMVTGAMGADSSGPVLRAGRNDTVTQLD